MSTLGISARERAASRISFYLLVGLVMWMTNQLLPGAGEWERQQWEARGVVQPLIGVPLDEVSGGFLPGSR